MKNIDDIANIWNLMTYDYDEFTSKKESYSNEIEWPCIQRLLPDLKNKYILDIGCGSGRFTNYFLDYFPEKVIGIDISEKMIELAKSKNESDVIDFINESVDNIDLLYNNMFDFVFSSTSTHYFSNIEKVFKNISTSMINNGVLIISVMHPIYTSEYPFTADEEWKMKYLRKEIRSYYQPWTMFGKSQNGVVCKSYHYTFSDYINALIKSGFIIEEIQEPEPPQTWKDENQEKYEDLLDEPLYMVIKCKKVVEV